MKTLVLFFLLAGTVMISAQTATNVNVKPMSPKTVVAPTNPNAITPAEWQELRTAREAALKANPDLLKESAAFAQKMRDFQHRVDQAILQADPSVADVVTRIENGPARPPSGPPPAMPQPNGAPPPASH
jgi:soluble cytochrome b562